MKIWELSCDLDEKYIDFKMKSKEKGKKIMKIDRNEKTFENAKKTIVSLKEEIFEDELEIIGGSEKADCYKFWTLGSYPILSSKAKEILSPLIEENVYFIPLKCKDEKLYLLVVKQFIDCIDKENSEFSYYSSGIVRKITNLKLKKNKINTDLFKIYSDKIHIYYSHIYVNDEIKKAVERNKMKGFEFLPVEITNE